MPLFTARTRVILAHLKPITLSTGFALSLPVRYGFAFSTSSVTVGGANGPSCTRYMLRRPNEAALRESPWPVVFLRARGLGLEEEAEWKDWSAMFAEKGYTAVEIDITAASSPTSALSDGSDQSQTVTLSSSNQNSDGDAAASNPLAPMTSLLASQIRLLAVPFPPIIIAQKGSCLLAQAYIEDNPASGLVLIHPPPDEDPRTGQPQGQGQISDQDQGSGTSATTWAWPKFTYEPHFPLLVMSTHAGLNALSTTSRIVREGDAGQNRRKSESASKKSGGLFSAFRSRGKGLELDVLDEGDLNNDGRIAVERWMDCSGF